MRIFVGLTMTALWLFGVGCYIWHGWADFSSLDFNEMGDFFAGAIAPLAFLWLIIGYFQQGHELEQNTRAIELQARELKESVEQQKNIANNAKQELEHLIDQARIADSLRVDREQPILVNKYMNHEGGDTPLKVSFAVFENFGLPAIQCQLRLVDDDQELVEFKPDTPIKYWKTDTDNRYTLRYSDAKLRALGKASLKFALDYTDIRGRQNCINYESEIAENGRLGVFKRIEG
jgi:hypothetical protein